MTDEERADKAETAAIATRIIDLEGALTDLLVDIGKVTAKAKARADAEAKADLDAAAIIYDKARTKGQADIEAAGEAYTIAANLHADLTRKPAD